MMLWSCCLMLALGTDDFTVREDFDGNSLPPTLTVSNGTWRPMGGELRGSGSGHLDLTSPIGGDFDLTFECSTAAKSNVEVHLVDPATNEARLTCAFLGQYHTALKGARSCILDGQNFVSVMPEMWIWPEHRFTFRVHREGSNLSMSLDGAAGPAYSAASDRGARIVRIVVNTAAANGDVRIDSLSLRAASPSKEARSATPPTRPPVPSDDPAAAPILDTVKTKNLVVHNHADASIVTATAAAELQRQYDWLKTYVGVAPPRIEVHIGNDYPCGFSRSGPGDPAMFLQAGSIFDSSANYAHEMLHCFTFHYGALPHWFAESLADMAYLDAEIELWKRRNEAPFLKTFDHAEHRSFELAKLRMRFGNGYFPKVCRILERRLDECRATFTPNGAIESKNALLIAVLSEAASTDLLPYLRDELGFDSKTRERQRGY